VIAPGKELGELSGIIREIGGRGMGALDDDAPMSWRIVDVVVAFTPTSWDTQRRVVLGS
jgi:hypothetical protein